jgi:type II secretory ATPase GspE/PulE/Tfp pilus assembly ATPase PilB-like protein
MSGSTDPTTTPEPDAPAALEALIRRAEAARASDIHLQMTGRTAAIAFRLDGRLTPAGELDASLAERVFGRIKYLARLKTYQESLPQDGRIERGDVQAASDIRVATYPTVTGEKIVLRLFDLGPSLTLDELSFPDAVLTELREYLGRGTGMLLLTGPSGSGKTTTIYACLRHLAAQGGRHIITVEDPVEQIVAGVMQTEVNEAAGLGFAKAARHLLRQDPQVLVLGEIRDEETAQLALRAALTGHLVISTLHAGSCPAVFDRLLLLGQEPFAVFSAVELVLNQRLVRRLCAQCRGSGCPECVQTGFRGRVPIVEHLRMNDALRARARVEGTAILKSARPLELLARELPTRGVTSPAEIGQIFQP